MAVYPVTKIFSDLRRLLYTKGELSERTFKIFSRIVFQRLILPRNRLMMRSRIQKLTKKNTRAN